jgi:arabinan endo-1,5-alpha-L-arabinosidase
MGTLAKPRYKKAAGTILVSSGLLLAVLGGCVRTPAANLVYPNAPPPDRLYDTSILDNEQAWTINNAHDPSIIKTEQGYYVFSTDVRVGGTPRPGIMVRKSDDLIHWKWVGYALNGIPEEAEKWSGAQGLWAPDVSKSGDEYRLYYAASSFGSNRSFIGLAASKSIEGPWTDRGEVIKTDHGDPPNAIDPNVVTDTEGKPWLVYGSFFGGIYILPLDGATGKPKEPGFGTLIAARDSLTEQGAVEAPFIIYQPKFKKYYLFVSYDSLFSDYNVRVARSDSIDGPYVDSEGHEMTNTYTMPQSLIGNKILGGYKFSTGEGWVAPGHNSVLIDGDNYYMVHHARGETDKNWPYLHVRKMLWTDSGWPVVSPERYAGETVQPIPAKLIAGRWERIVQDPAADGQVAAKPLELESGGGVKTAEETGKWTFDGRYTMTIRWKSGSEETVKLLASWDWENNRPTLVFTGMNGKGVSVWGKKAAPAPPEGK